MSRLLLAWWFFFFFFFFFSILSSFRCTMMIGSSFVLLPRTTTNFATRVMRPIIASSTIRPPSSWWRRYQSTMNALYTVSRHLQLELRIPTAQDMEDMGGLLFSILNDDTTPSKGATILLDGDLGAGKTAFARGFIRAATGDYDERVTSPTYLLSNTYRYDDVAHDGQQECEIYHMDLYRLGPKDDLTPLNLPHVLERCIALIEWPARLGSENIPHDRLEVQLNIISEGEVDNDIISEDVSEDAPRRMVLTPHGSSWNRRISELLKGGYIDDLVIHSA